MIQICKKDKEKVFEAIRTGQIDAAELSFPNLIDDIVLTMKYQGLTDLLPLALSDKRRDNKHIPFDILLCLAPAGCSKELQRNQTKNGAHICRAVFWHLSFP